MQAFWVEFCKRESFDADYLVNEHGIQDVEFLDSSYDLTFDYPVHIYPAKVKPLNLDKTPEIKGTLQGIKGQYLILDSGVINLRKFGGYHVDVAFIAD